MTVGSKEVKTFFVNKQHTVFSEFMLSPIRHLSVLLVYPTQPVEIFRIVSMPLGTLTIH